MELGIIIWGEHECRMGSSPPPLQDGKGAREEDFVERGYYHRAPVADMHAKTLNVYAYQYICEALSGPD